LKVVYSLKYLLLDTPIEMSSILGVAGGLLALFVSVVYMTIHVVDEGHRGVYYRGGALLNYVSEPGFHLKSPITTLKQVQVTVQTDSVTNIPCGTSGGVVINFGKVEVVNRLRVKNVLDTVRNYTTEYDKTWIFDKIHHEINQFCSSHSLQEVYITKFETLDENLQQALQRDCVVWAPGIEIIAVRVTKPRVPEQIRRNYEKMEGEKTQLLIAIETQKVVEMEAETDKLKATIIANKQREVSELNMKKKIMEKEAEQKIAKLEDEISGAHQKAKSDAEYYRIIREAEANNKRLTKEFIEYTRIVAMSNNTKVYFGNKIPNMVTTTGISTPNN
jgi:erlin